MNLPTIIETTMYFFPVHTSYFLPEIYHICTSKNYVS